MRLFKLKNCKRVGSVHLAPDGRSLLAVGGYEVGQVDTAIGLDLDTGAERYRLGGFVAWFAVDPALTRFVIATERGLAWQALPPEGEWRPIEFLRPPGSDPRETSVYALSLDRTGMRLAYAYGWTNEESDVDEIQYGVAVIGMDSSIRPVWRPTSDGVFRLAFDTAGTRLAASGGLPNDSGGVVFDVSSGHGSNFGRLGNQTRDLAFLPDGRLVVANKKTVHVYRESGEPQFALAGHAKQVNAIAVTPDGRRVFSASHDGTVRVWDTAAGTEVAAFDWKIGPVTAVAIAADGLTAAAGSATGRVVVWDVDG